MRTPPDGRKELSVTVRTTLRQGRPCTRNAPGQWHSAEGAVAAGWDGEWAAARAAARAAIAGTQLTGTRLNGEEAGGGRSGAARDLSVPPDEPYASAAAAEEAEGHLQPVLSRAATDIAEAGRRHAALVGRPADGTERDRLGRGVERSRQSPGRTRSRVTRGRPGDDQPRPGPARPVPRLGHGLMPELYRELRDQDFCPLGAGTALIPPGTCGAAGCRCAVPARCVLRKGGVPLCGDDRRHPVRWV